MTLTEMDLFVCSIWIAISLPHWYFVYCYCHRHILPFVIGCWISFVFPYIKTILCTIVWFTFFKNVEFGQKTLGGNLNSIYLRSGSLVWYVLALHVAVQCGHVEAVRVLLTESSINAEAYNARWVSALFGCPMVIFTRYAFIGRMCRSYQNRMLF